MSHGVLLALRRNRETAEKAGMTERVARLDERISILEAELAEPVVVQTEGAAPVEAEKQETPEPEAVAEVDAWAGVEMTPAARNRAEELGLSPEDFEGEQPSGKAGFLVSDVERIANEEEDEDGDD